MQLAEVSFDVWFPPDLLRLEQLMQEEFKTAADETAEGMVELVRAKIITPDERGRVIDSSHELLESVEGEADDHGDVISAEAWSDARQAEYVEEGRDTGYVSPQVILDWMLEKGISPRPGETTLQAAHAIATKIAREGYEGRHIFARSLEEAESLAIEAVDRAVTRINRRLS